MSKPNGRQARAIQGLASALQECLDASVEASEKRMEEKWGPRFDRQDETLRMIWRQCGGKPEQRLPIDD